MKKWLADLVRANREEKYIANWFARMVRVNRGAIYIVICGIASLITIPTVQAFVTSNGWVVFVYVVIVNLAAAVIVKVSLYPITSKLPRIAKRPDRKPTPREPSKFAQKRLREEQPDLVGSPLVFEARLPVTVLFIPFIVKTSLNPRDFGPDPSSARNAIVRNWRQLERKLGKDTIYFPVIRFLGSLVPLAVIVVITVQPSVEWGNLELAAIALFALYPAVKIVPLYNRWARWFYYRVLAFESRTRDGKFIPAQLVAINKPLLLPGGSAPAIPIAKIQAPWTSTAPDGVSEESFISVLAGMMKIRYIRADIIGEEAELFNSMGPFKSAVHYNNLLQRMSGKNDNS